jgi:hypothetical protein
MTWLSTLERATPAEEEGMIAAFEKDANASVFYDTENHAQAVCCSVCDTMGMADTEWKWIMINELQQYCEDAKMTKGVLEGIYPEMLVAQYTVKGCPTLENYVLSSSSIIDETACTICLCDICYNHFQANLNQKRFRRTPPIKAIIMGYLIGEAPAVLKNLNEVELALISTVRTTCQSWVYFAGCHQHIQGWHTFYENKPGAIASQIENLSNAGMKGQLLVVLCGPFTSTQRAMTRAQTLVDAQKVINAFRWLKENNIHYAEIEIPNVEDLPIPRIIENNM